MWRDGAGLTAQDGCTKNPLADARGYNPVPSGRGSTISSRPTERTFLTCRVDNRVDAWGPDHSSDEGVERSLDTARKSACATYLPLVPRGHENLK